jgi:type I restriction enzyme S subunit
MIADLKPYPEYKESGHVWLGAVPTHWNVLPNRAIFSEIKERDCPDEEMLSVTITRGIVRQKALLADSSKKDSSNTNKAAYKLVQPGDIAYNKMRAWQGALGASNLRGIISPAYVVMRPLADANPLYFHNLYRTPMFAKEAERWSYGITSDMWSLRPEHFKLIGSLLPPTAEQAAIVRFLDHWNGRLEKAIRSKRRVIALLQEQKHAIIHRAVTRGLDPNVKLKDSGIPWLGEIPEHWETWPLRRCITIRSGDFADPVKLRRDQTKEANVPVIGGNGVMGYLDKSNNTGTTIVIGRVGALCGNVHLVEGSAWITDNALRITRITGFEAPYLAEQLRTMDLNRLSNANAQPLITGGTVKSQRVVKPPTQEQRDIVEMIPILVAPITTAIARYEREITLLREYRTRLTADVVTGKLDVRAAAAQLPEEAEEEPLPDPELPEEETEGEEVEG